MKIKDFNSTGFTHYLVMILIIVGVAVIGTAYLVSSHAATPCKGSTFYSGASGQCVKDIQSIVNGAIKRPYGIGTDYVKDGGVLLTVDGQYGPKTKADVVAFQKSSNSWWYNDNN